MLHSSLVDLIHRSGRKNGWGAVSRPDYYSGCGVDSLWWDYRTAPEKLFLFWQECKLLEMLNELPEGSADTFAELVRKIPVLYPDDFLSSLHIWGASGYPVSLEYRCDYRDSIGTVCYLLEMRDRERDYPRDLQLSQEIKKGFFRLIENFKD